VTNITVNPVGRWSQRGFECRRIVPVMSTASESSGVSKPDCAHLDEDAECLEDPVHCGDARHQHDAHRSPAGATDAATATTEEPAQP
jgi:hypothetical protein